MINTILLKPFGLKLTRIKKEEKSADDEVFLKILEQCRPYTMTTVERMRMLYQAVKYIVKYNIPGDFVECGVWRGGSSMVSALTLQSLGVRDRQLYLYDTFEGMSEPTPVDITFRGDPADVLLKQSIHNKETSVWCLAGIDDVKRNMGLTGYPSANVHYIKGKVEDTIPATLPAREIALLRLDTDWYESTRHELIYLYPLLTTSGALIIDDYGHWDGCRKAVDEYFQERPVFLNHIDYTGRFAIKSS